MNKTNSIGILSIATRHYKSYWKSMVESAAENLPRNLDLTFHLFTDNIPNCSDVVDKYDWLKFEFHAIPSFGWPEATLYRYEIYSKYAHEIHEELLMHLDADMLIKADFSTLISQSKLNAGIGLVRHPGYYRPALASRFWLYSKLPILLIRDLQSLVFTGSLGSWETRKVSTAFVPRVLRKNYYCGGVWFGFNSTFKSLLQDLKLQVEIDSQNGVVALWHDESHLNRWAACNLHTSFLPSLCFDESYPQLRGLPNFITAVDKAKASQGIG